MLSHFFNLDQHLCKYTGLYVSYVNMYVYVECQFA